VYCTKINKSRLCRTLNVVTREGLFEVEYRNNFVMENVLVDGVLVGAVPTDLNSRRLWFRQYHRFSIGGRQALLRLKIGWNFKIQTFCLDVEGQSVYAEYTRSSG
jgi:hypothetical protein